MRRISILLGLLALIPTLPSIVAAQVGSAGKRIEATYGPDIQVTASHHAQSKSERHRCYTRYLIYKGAWNRTSLDDLSGPNLPGHGPKPLQSTIKGYHPSDIQAAYGIPANSGSNAIAIVDAYSDHFIQSDFNTFSQQFGLPTETSSDITSWSNTHLQVVYAGGTKPAENASWSSEESLDVEWAHAVAPGAKIYLVEAQDNSNAALADAVRVAAQLPNVKQVSMSYGSDSEVAGEQSEDSVYTQPGVVYFASTGDYAGVRGYPSMSPNVVAVGGTKIAILSGHVQGLSAWAQSGAGASTIVPRPSFQNGVTGAVGNFRGTPDISSVGDPATGVAVYSSFDDGWIVVGGTSLSTPVCAAIANARGNFSASSPNELSRLYGQIGQTTLRDVTVGTINVVDGTNHQLTGEVLRASVGYDLASGLGEPVGLLGSAGTQTTALPGSLSSSVGSSLGGGVNSLNAADGNCYSLVSKYQAGNGQVASVDVLFRATAPSGSTLKGVALVYKAFALSGTTIQISALNASNGLYEAVGNAGLSSGGTSGNFTLNLPTQVDSSGNVRLRLVATRPLRYGFSSFVFRLDQAVLSLTSSP